MTFPALALRQSDWSRSEQYFVKCVSLRVECTFAQQTITILSCLLSPLCNPDLGPLKVTSKVQMANLLLCIACNVSGEQDVIETSHLLKKLMFFSSKRLFLNLQSRSQ